MKISQETYDETLLENEEIFSLTPSEAIQETISQFEQQGITNLSSYIVTSHPSSKEGQEERKVRSVFTSLLNKLDSFIRSDGTVELVDEQQGDCDKSDVMVNTINEIHGFYKYRVKNGQQGVEEDEKDGNIVFNNNDPIPFLTLTHSTSSMFTFMNLLSIIDLSTVGSEQDTTGRLAIPTEKERKILDSTLKLLITILSPKNKNEKEIKLFFKDTFVCMERMIGLIVYHMMIIIQLKQNNDNNVEEKDNDHLQQSVSSLTLLVKCVMNACKNCEKNKVLFVRCLKASRVSESIRKVINCWNNYKFFLSKDSNSKIQSNNENGDGMNKKQKESTVGIICNLITLSLIVHKSTTDIYPQNLASTIITLMTECCKLISVLCRFDDFRTSEQTSETNNHASLVDSSYGGVSSAHDHVLEFNREGVIPTLHELILLSLDQNNLTANGSVGCGDNQVELAVGLAAAAMSSTRVLAVNDEIVQALVAVGILKSVKVVLDMSVVETNDVDKVTKKEAKQNSDEDVQEDDDVENVDNQRIPDNKVLFLQRQQLATGAVGLIRNLSGNDEIKTTLCLGSNTSSTANGTSNTTVPSVLPSIMQAMSIYKNCSALQEHGCGALAAMALRKPSNASRIIHENGASSILTALKLFPTNVLVQRQGALAIRNIVSRLVANTSSEDTMQNETVESVSNNEGVNSTNNTEENSTSVRDIFLDLGAEVVLRGITGRHQGSVDEAYAALRDLGINVSMLKYDAETQTTTSRTVMFGDIKPQFRAVYDESG